MSQEAKLPYVLRTNALKNTTNHNSIKQYKRGITEFCQWCKDTYNIKYPSQINNATNYIQQYEKHLETKYTSAQTIKAKLVPITKGFGVSLKEIEKPKIRIADIKRGRSIGSADRNIKISADPRFAKLDKFAKMTGLRRNEIARLRKCDIIKDEMRNICINALKTKGGKHQLQRILPCYEKEVLKYFDYHSGEKIFSSDTMKNKMNIHLYRAELARKAYDYYKEKAKSPYKREKLYEELLARYDKFHRPNAKEKKKFIDDIEKGNGIYKLRGTVRELAIKKGRPIQYDRLISMYVSVFYLSHWRNNVTIDHYLV